MIALVCASFTLLLLFRVFSPRVLRAAPTRQSRLSLLFVGGAILLFFVIEVALGAGAIRLGLIRNPDSRIDAPASAPAQTFPATTAPTTEALPTTTPAGARASPDAHQIVASNCIEGAAELITVALILIAVRPLFREKLGGLGVHISQIPEGVGKGILAFVIVNPILNLTLVGMVWFYTQVHHQMSEHSTFEALDQHLAKPEQWVLFVMASTIAPLAEEVFFRGLLQTSLIQFGWGLVIPQFMPAESLPGRYRPGNLQRWAAIVVTSLLFANVHATDHGPVLFLLSIAIGYIYERTGNLWAPITLHAVFNTVQILSYFARR